MWYFLPPRSTTPGQSLGLWVALGLIRLGRSQGHTQSLGCPCLVCRVVSGYPPWAPMFPHPHTRLSLSCLNPRQGLGVDLGLIRGPKDSAGPSALVESPPRLTSVLVEMMAQCLLSIHSQVPWPHPLGPQTHPSGDTTKPEPLLMSSARKHTGPYPYIPLPF